MLRAEPADPGTNIEEVNTMIKKWIENTDEVHQRLTQMLMDDASDMCRFQRDIYMYIDEDGQARLEWFENPGGNSWVDDDHILLHRCRQHYEECIEDAASDYADQADEIMRAYCRSCYEDAAMIEENTNAVPIVWLFVIDADDQRALDKQRGGENNGRY